MEIKKFLRQLGRTPDENWSRSILRICCVMVPCASLLEFPLLLLLPPEALWKVITGNAIMTVICIIVFIGSRRGSVLPGSILLSASILVFITAASMPSDLLYAATGAALVIPVLLIGVVTNFSLALIFGLLAIGVLIGSAAFSGLPWTPYTYASVFVIAIAVGLLWLIHQLIDTVQERNRQLADYATQAEELAIERERTRLAREIHDGVGHVLMAINMQIEAARARIDQDLPGAPEALVLAQRYTKEAAAEIRRSIRELRTLPSETRPLPEAVAALADEIQANGLAVEVQVRGPYRTLTPQCTLALTRIVQEALTNVRKHAQATEVHITLDYLAGPQIRLVVEDNGIGAAQQPTGYGLLGISERAHALGGTAITRSAPGAGFSLTVEIPS